LASFLSELFCGVEFIAAVSDVFNEIARLRGSDAVLSGEILTLVGFLTPHTSTVLYTAVGFVISHSSSP
jgi:hypothetical protein